MKVDKPTCAACEHMKCYSRAKITANTHRYPRKECYCEHKRMQEAFSRYYGDRYAPTPGFICFTSGRDGTMTTKTAPRWCPLRDAEKQATED